MERKARNRFNTLIYEEACEWFIEFRAGHVDALQRRELDTWLRKSPEHLRAYLEIAAIWDDGPLLDPAGKWDAEILLAQAADEPDNIVSHPNHSRAGSSPAVPTALHGVARGNGRRFLALATSVLIVCLGAWLYSQRNVYVTDIGEQRSIRLADGSTVDLNSRSRIKVLYTSGERAIDLLEGQALFQVAKNVGRPFVVASGNTRVRVIGTQFDVNRTKAGTIVTVLEGRVAVLPERASLRIPSSPETPPSKAPQVVTRTSQPLIEKPVYLSAGEQLSVTRLATPQPIVANVAAATAWRQRQLVFESATLAEVVEEFNRYNKRQLTVQDVDLYDFHISGVFSSIEAKGLLDFLRSRPGVEVTETASGYLITKKSSLSGN